MTRPRTEMPIALVVAALGVVAPLLLPALTIQFAFLWVMVVFALSWDVLGGQMGYNSFGNVVFFGIGMYVCAVIQVAPFTDLAEYTSASGTQDIGLSHAQYFIGLGIGCLVGALAAVAVAALLGSAILGLRGHYFAICTLGLGIAAGEIAAGIDLIGAGSGMVTPLFPGEIGERQRFFYYLCFALAVVLFLTLRRVYAGRFGLAINAIRDDEDKAEAMGIRTTRYKTVAWCIAAFFLGIAGGLVGNIVGFIDPTEVAFAGATFGVWMVLMAILGGKGTLWGPVLGAVVFHVTQELFWTFLFGWQRVALGLLIVVIVVFFPQGIVGWLRERYPERFGHRIAPAEGSTREGTQPS
ncbi:MAG: branched-chain amino acid ABC transporter permease [Gammaproteobacteria bacterium]|jgi:branched-chain amino acid transport system permease protein